MNARRLVAAITACALLTTPLTPALAAAVMPAELVLVKGSSSGSGSSGGFRSAPPAARPAAPAPARPAAPPPATARPAAPPQAQPVPPQATRPVPPVAAPRQAQPPTPARRDPRRDDPRPSAPPPSSTGSGFLAGVAGFLLMDALFNSNRSQAAPASQAGAVAPAVPAPSDTAPAIAVPEGRDDAALPAPLVTDPVDEGRPFWAYLLPIAFWAMIIGGGIWLVRRLFGRRTTS